MTTNKWVLLLGGPNSGKTTLADFFIKHGYIVKKEQARAVLDTYIERGIPFEDIVKNGAVGAAFQEEIAKKELRAEESLDQETLIFFDRSCIEYAAFVALRTLPPNTVLLEELSSKKYALAVALDVIPTAFAGNKIESDWADPVAESLRQAAALEEVVQQMGTPIERVPVLPVPERAEFIVQLCKKYNLIG